MPESEPFVNVEYVSPMTPPTTSEEVKAYASQFFNTLEEFNIGRGSKSFKVDPSGAWLGGNLFSQAPFSVDMLGNVVANSILINGLGGDIIAGAIDSNGNFINELISVNLNTQSKAILGEFIFTGSGALAMATDANNGVWISPTGILGKKAGATTFAIESDGDATFGGTLVAASGTFGTVTAGTFTGVTIQTASSGYRAVMSSSNGFQLYNGTSYVGGMKADTAASVIFDTADNFYFIEDSATYRGQLDSNGWNLPAGKAYQFASGRKFTDVSSYIECDGGFVATSSIRADSYNVKPASTEYQGDTDTDIYVASTSGGSPTKRLRVRGGIVTTS